MPSYADRNRSLLYALSDFWTQIFADSDTVASLYRGAEILVGQIYLDLLGDMLNMSVRDTALFRKELFRLVRVREDTVLRAPDGRFRVPLGPDVVSMPVLNNKVFAVTAALERGVDYVQVDDKGVEGTGSTALFQFDPTAAQPTLVVGAGTSAMRFTGVIPGVGISVDLVDDGTVPVSVGLSFLAGEALLTVQYDGPANGGTATAASIVAAVSAVDTLRDRVMAEVLSTGSTTSPEATGAPVPLSYAQALPVLGYGARAFQATFGSKFTYDVPYALAGVRKGDTLRLEISPRAGAAVEVPIALVRGNSLYSHFAAAPTGAAQSDLSLRDFTVLRTPADPVVEQEPWVTVTGIVFNADVDRATGTLYAPGIPPLVSWGLMTASVSLGGALNAGPVVLESWDPGTERFTILGTDLSDETAVPVHYDLSLERTLDLGVFTLTEVTGMPGHYDVDGLVGLDRHVGGVMWFTDDLTVPGLKARVLENNAGVLRIHQIQTSDVLAPTLNVVGISVVTLYPFEDYTFLLDTTNSVNANQRTELLQGSLRVYGRRLLDGQALVEGADWAYVPDQQWVRWYSVPDTSSNITFDYEIRKIITRSRDQLVDFTSLALDYVGGGDTRVKLRLEPPGPISHTWRVGDRVDITDTYNYVNDGTYYVAELLPDGEVVLGGDRTPILPESNNGSLYVETWPTGTLDIDAPEERVTEVAMWAPDIHVDRMSLASTYGYLLDRIEPSSEQYRSTIRGLMQLYMLGPTPARLEAAVHVLAGLPVVRDDNELVLRYVRDVAATGSGIALYGTTRTARLLTGSFAAAPLEGYLFITSGLNEGRSFRIEARTSHNELLLDGEPFTDDASGLGVTWEIVSSDTHSVVTDRNTYELPVTVPFRAEYTDPASWGVLRLPAFSTFSGAVQVKDETASPGWWQSARIPAVLWPGQSGSRLQSSPAYVEHVVGPEDGACIGDPGLTIGTDDVGTVVPVYVVVDEIGDGSAVIRTDPFAPFSYENATFTSMATTTDPDHVGYELRFTLSNGESLEAQILGVVDNNTWRVGLPMTVPSGEITDVDRWQLVVDPATLRHNTAFVVFDRYLKQHVFQVDIDATLLGRIDARLLTDIQARLREVKPAHTYMLLSPSTVLTDVLYMDDTMFRARDVYTSGVDGESVFAQPNELRIDGSWRIGDFFRYDDWSRTDDLTGPIDPITMSAPGYFTDLHALEWTSGVTNGGQPADLTIDFGQTGFMPAWIDGTADLEAADASGGAWLTFADPLPADLQRYAVLAVVTLGGSSTQPGTYRAGRVDVAGNRVRIYLPGGVAEAGIDARVERGSSFEATVSRRADGSTRIVAPEDCFPATGSVGDWSADGSFCFVEPLVPHSAGDSAITTGLVDPAAPWQILGPAAPGEWNIGFVTSQVRSGYAFTGTVTQVGLDTILTLDPSTPPEYLFTADMGYTHRAALDPATAGAVMYGVEFTSGSNTNKPASIHAVISDYVAVLEGLGPSIYTGTYTFGTWQAHAASLPAAPVTLPVRVIADAQRTTLIQPSYDSGGIITWTDLPVDVTNLLTGYIDTTEVSFNAHGRVSAVDLGVTVADPELGDTPFMIGGLSPSVRGIRRNSQFAFDLTELPIEITRTPVIP